MRIYNYLKNFQWKSVFKKLDMVAHACNASYLGGRVQEDCNSKPVQAQMLARPHFNQ
jgi:hypothetical protein